MSQEKSMIH